MQTKYGKKLKSEQLDLFRSKPASPDWHSLPKDAKHRVTELLAKLIAGQIFSRLTVSDQKELTDE